MPASVDPDELNRKMLDYFDSHPVAKLGWDPNTVAYPYSNIASAGMAITPGSVERRAKDRGRSDAYLFQGILNNIKKSRPDFFLPESRDKEVILLREDRRIREEPVDPVYDRYVTSVEGKPPKKGKKDTRDRVLKNYDYGISRSTTGHESAHVAFNDLDIKEYLKKNGLSRQEENLIRAMDMMASPHDDAVRAKTLHFLRMKWDIPYTPLGSGGSGPLGRGFYEVEHLEEESSSPISKLDSVKTKKSQKDIAEWKATEKRFTDKVDFLTVHAQNIFDIARNKMDDTVSGGDDSLAGGRHIDSFEQFADGGLVASTIDQEREAAVAYFDTPNKNPGVGDEALVSDGRHSALFADGGSVDTSLDRPGGRAGETKSSRMVEDSPRVKLQKAMEANPRMEEQHSGMLGGLFNIGLDMTPYVSGVKGAYDTFDDAAAAKESWDKGDLWSAAGHGLASGLGGLGIAAGVGGPTRWGIKGAKAGLKAADEVIGKFRTSRGSLYNHFADATTQRDRSGLGHPDTSTGLQLKSGKTVFVSKDDVNKIAGLFQNQEIATKLVPYTDDAGNLKARLVHAERYGLKKAGDTITEVHVTTKPELGKHPVEIWGSDSPIGDPGKSIHFGSEITEIAGKNTPEQIRIANNTSRAGGAVGKMAVTPRWVADNVDKSDKILDFGAGTDAIHAKSLRENGYNVTAHEFGDNVREGIHKQNALSETYDVVYASNVLNVQSSEEMLRRTLGQIRDSVSKDGLAVFNYPASPRKSDLTVDQVSAIIAEVFPGAVERVNKGSGTPMWTAKLLEGYADGGLVTPYQQPAVAQQDQAQGVPPATTQSSRDKFSARMALIMGDGQGQNFNDGGYVQGFANGGLPLQPLGALRPISSNPLQPLGTLGSISKDWETDPTKFGPAGNVSRINASLPGFGDDAFASGDVDEYSKLAGSRFYSPPSSQQPTTLDGDERDSIFGPSYPSSSDLPFISQQLNYYAPQVQYGVGKLGAKAIGEGMEYVGGLPVVSDIKKAIGDKLSQGFDYVTHDILGIEDSIDNQFGSEDMDLYGPVPVDPVPIPTGYDWEGGAQNAGIMAALRIAAGQDPQKAAVSGASNLAIRGGLSELYPSAAFAVEPASAVAASLISGGDWQDAARAGIISGMGSGASAAATSAGMGAAMAGMAAPVVGLVIAGVEMHNAAKSAKKNKQAAERQRFTAPLRSVFRGLPKLSPGAYTIMQEKAGTGDPIGTRRDMANVTAVDAGREFLRKYPILDLETNPWRDEYHDGAMIGSHLETYIRSVDGFGSDWQSLWDGDISYAEFARRSDISVGNFLSENAAVISGENAYQSAAANPYMGPESWDPESDGGPPANEINQEIIRERARRQLERANEEIDIAIASGASPERISELRVYAARQELFANARKWEQEMAAGEIDAPDSGGPGMNKRYGDLMEIINPGYQDKESWYGQDDSIGDSTAAPGGLATQEDIDEQMSQVPGISPEGLAPLSPTQENLVENAQFGKDLAMAEAFGQSNFASEQMMDAINAAAFGDSGFGDPGVGLSDTGGSSVADTAGGGDDEDDGGDSETSGGDDDVF